MRLLNVVATAGLLLSIVSCGDHHKSSSHRAPAVDPLITNADWKILLEGRSFPNKAMVMIDDQIVVNECSNKQSYFIDRDSNPQSLSMQNFLVPSESTVKVEIFDLGASCADESDDSKFHDGPKTHFEMTKDGAHAEVLIRL